MTLTKAERKRLAEEARKLAGDEAAQAKLWRNGGWYDGGSCLCAMATVLVRAGLCTLDDGPLSGWPSGFAKASRTIAVIAPDMTGDVIQANDGAPRKLPAALLALADALDESTGGTP